MEGASVVVVNIVGVVVDVDDVVDVSVDVVDVVVDVVVVGVVVVLVVGTGVLVVVVTEKKKRIHCRYFLFGRHSTAIRQIKVGATIRCFIGVDLTLF